MAVSPLCGRRSLNPNLTTRPQWVFANTGLLVQQWVQREFVCLFRAELPAAIHNMTGGLMNQHLLIRVKDGLKRA
jgi:hypothetical protein